MFSQLKINANPNIPSEPNESSKNNTKQKEMKKYLTKPIIRPNDEKGKNNDKDKNTLKKDVNDSNIQKDRSITIINNNINKNFDKKKSEFLDNHPKKEDNKKEKEKNVDKKPNAEIKESNMAEKKKCLELYFKIRNEGLGKSNTEVSKGYCLTENNITCKTMAKPMGIEEWVREENDTMANLDFEENPDEFNEENYKERRYDKNNVESGKKFFKKRYIKNKLKSNISNLEKKQKDSKEKDDSIPQQNYDKERILRKYNSDFILIIEKSIISFNVKNYKESYEFLESSGIIKNAGEYGEFLLVVSGFDKFLIGEFLAKQKYPNNNKEVLNNFIESINMKKSEIKFIDCLRFLFSRLILPKDANLILEIMDKFSINYFDTNKSDSNFVNIFKSSDKIYLLVSTILALNTMFTRKDIKIKNVIKKDEFIKMNSEISKDFIEKLYDEIKKNPISMSDDYNESMYKKLAPLVKEDEGGNKATIEEKQEEGNNNKPSEKTSRTSGFEDQITEEDEYDDELFDDELKKGLGKKEFSLKTNINNFTEEDEKILKTPHKFYKITGSNKTSIREYVLNDDKTKLLYDKKQKKFLVIKNLIDAYNGINHSHNSNIKKYLKNNPSEEKFSGHFISLIFGNDKDQVDLLSDDLESALLWFKAIKSFILTYNKKDDMKFGKEYEKYINEKTEEIWDSLLNKWNIYGKYLIITLMERNRFIQKEEKQSNNILKTHKKLSFKFVYNFFSHIKKKMAKDKELDYNEFITFYYLGLPNRIRNKIWQILIGNPCGIYINTYEFVKKHITIIDFSTLDINNQSNKNYCQDNLSNKIINEIIKSKELFTVEESQKNLDRNLLMTQLYNVSRCFFIFRPDIPFNKSIISIVYLFLVIFKDEKSTFCNVVNLVCSNALKLFIADENEIKNYCSFFNILLGKYLDKIEKHFSKLEITPQLYIVPWFEELFTRTLNIKLLSHIFDLYLINGEIVLYQTSLAIIKYLEEELLNLTINEVFKALQRFPENAVEMDLMSKINYFSCIKKQFFDWKLQDELASQKSNLFTVLSSS